jgi:hypothetical protein
MALILLEFHLVRRFLETAWLMKYPPGARMHGIAYVFGLRQAPATMDAPLLVPLAFQDPSRSWMPKERRGWVGV